MIASFNSQETFEWFIEAVVEADRKTEPIPHDDYVEWGNDHIKRNACTLELFDNDGVYIEPQRERSE